MDGLMSTLGVENDYHSHAFPNILVSLRSACQVQGGGESRRTINLASSTLHRWWGVLIKLSSGQWDHTRHTSSCLRLMVGT